MLKWVVFDRGKCFGLFMIGGIFVVYMMKGVIKKILIFGGLIGVIVSVLVFIIVLGFVVGVVGVLYL